MFLPIHDGHPRKHIPLHYATLGLIAANAVVYALFQFDILTGAWGDERSFGVIPITFASEYVRPAVIDVIPEPLTLVTSSFIHADFWHLLGNMLFLWVFGDNVEDAMGHLRFVVFYLLCAVASALLYVAINPDSNAYLIGASGAVAGVVAAYLLLHPRVRVWVLFLNRIPLRLSAMWLLGGWAILQIVYAVLVYESAVAWWAHVGGLIAGGIIFMRRPGVPLFDQGLADQPSRP
ncbi:MAG: rhomboid family intramembrane serine protease [Bauldia sp.]|nr:rhomboid family intramembrane serine protease [Bauldia sp.]